MARLDADRAARGVIDVTLRRSGDDDVLGLGIIENVTHSGQARQIEHVAGGLLAGLELFFQGGFKTLQRDLAQLAAFGEIFIERDAGVANEG